jgi:hypothetical protein
VTRFQRIHDALLAQVPGVPPLCSCDQPWDAVEAVLVFPGGRATVHSYLLHCAQGEILQVPLCGARLDLQSVPDQARME